MAPRSKNQPALTLNLTPNLLSELNADQHQAVTHGTGPLLIVAGAGTGKTKVLTHRIAWLIQEGHAKPSEILALTFTDKAAGEMESRVDQLLPYGYTDTTISTFHAFGDQLLRDHALDLGLPPEFRVLGSDEQMLFLADRFDEIEELEELRPIGNPRKFVGAILKVISRAKDELVTPERYATVADELLQTATNGDEQREARRQRDIARIYAAYETFKAERGVIDFGDQILMLAQFLDRDARAKARLAERYRYILVDEFQDTNVAQYELVKRLLQGHQNLTVVGDDDQAIYKFRGAAVANILGFLQDFPAATTVVLTENYRSTQAILDAAYQLIKHNDPDRLEAKLAIQKRLHGQEPGTKPVFHWYKHEADELDALTEIIQRTRKTVPTNEIAILVRSNALVDTVTRALSAADIPYTASKDGDFTNRPEIRGVVAFLTALAHPDDSLAHVKLAFSPYYQLKPEWVLAINDAAKRARRTFHAVLSDESSVAWQRLDTDGQAALRAFRDDLTRYRQLIGTKNAGEILYQFLHDRGMLERLRDERERQPRLLDELPERERLEMVQNIAAVFEAIHGYIAAGRDSFTLTFVDGLPELLASIVPPSVNLGPDAEAIQVLTVHAAKGLEFDTVLLPSLMADRFPGRRRRDMLELPDALIAEALPSGDEHMEEERRLAYVAITRAKRQLMLSGAERVGTGTRPKKLSPFVVEALDLASVPAPLERLSSTQRIHAFAPRTPVPATLNVPLYDGVAFLSPAMIECYQRDPYDFYWKYVLKAPQPPSRHLVYGNAIHSAIEAYYRARLDGRTPTLDEVLRRYAEAWVSEGFESEQDENRQFEHGQQTLSTVVDRLAAGPTPTAVEQTFKLQLPGVVLNGRMDALFGEQREIRDFKTSAVESQKDADKKAAENIPIRIYALAYQRKFGTLPTRVVLDFVEANLTAEIQPDQAMMDSTLTLIQETVAAIKAGNFTPNPDNRFRDYE
ncbi:ATP-dependent helicase [Candidatus Berkelbacteria bacterium]|nr:ATP-dependent helicase [Candidatus Berkelbacteria bacterium]